MHLALEEGAAADIIAHCFFPNAQRVEHLMDAEIEVGPRAHLSYSEGNYHGPYGGVVVVPKAKVKVGAHGLYRSDFLLTTGRVGRLDIDYEGRRRRVASVSGLPGLCASCISSARSLGDLVAMAYP